MMEAKEMDGKEMDGKDMEGELIDRKEMEEEDVDGKEKDGEDEEGWEVAEKEEDGELGYLGEGGSMPALDEAGEAGEFMTVDAKIEMGLKAKEEGNVLFKKGEFEEARKAYDRAFVSVFIGKEDWAAIGDDERSKVNRFKAPCHLNRGLCRLKLGQLDEALWDFSEAVRIDPENAKARYRESIAKMEIIRREMEREILQKHWDVEKQEKVAAEVYDGLVFAAHRAPNDPMPRKALNELAEMRKNLQKTRHKHRRDQERTFSGFLRRGRQEPAKHEPVDYSGMPDLETVSITDN